MSRGGGGKGDLYPHFSTPIAGSCNPSCSGIGLGGMHKGQVSSAACQGESALHRRVSVGQSPGKEDWLGKA